MAWLEARFEKKTGRTRRLIRWPGGSHSLGYIGLREAKKQLKAFDEHEYTSRRRAKTFKEVAALYNQHCVASGFAKNTVNSRGYIVDGFLESFGEARRLSDITTADITCHIQNRRKTVMAATVNHDLTFLRGLFEFAIDNGYTDRSSVPVIRKLKNDSSPRQRSEVFIPGNLDRLLEASSPKTRAAIALMAGAGVRHREAMQLRWTDIDFETAKAIIVHDGRRNLKTKSGETRVTKLLPWVIDELLNWRDLSDDQEWIFPAKAGSTGHQREAYGALRTAYRNAGIDPGGGPAHLLRHLYATYLLSQGVSIASISKVLGHKSQATTAIYLHNTEEEAHNEIEEKLRLSYTKSYTQHSEGDSTILLAVSK